MKSLIDTLGLIWHAFQVLNDIGLPCLSLRIGGCSRGGVATIRTLGVSQASKHWSNFRTFVRANATTLWKIAYSLSVAFLFLAALWQRFSLPQ
ncbi:MAG TPA: hypothetical protein VLQ29_06025, partial [Candidatus Dormibacteraeota bacterium]|nr:hypothetical protein [Candidatus Dormibacteraeota bacterium]